MTTEEKAREALDLLEHAYKQCCASLQPKHQEIGTIGFDMDGWIAKAIEAFQPLVSAQPEEVTVEELVSQLNGIDSLDAMWISEHFPNGLKIIKEKNDG
jgi:hypothetical protein